VDAWDDEDDEDDGWGVPMPDARSNPQSAICNPQSSDADAIGDPQSAIATPQSPGLREMLRGAPPWIWVISGVGIALICAMMLAVLLLAASVK